MRRLCWYLPYLIEEADNTTPVKVRTVCLRNRAADSWEAFRYNDVSTVSDCVRLVLLSTIRDGVDDQIGFSNRDGTTTDQRKRVGRLWKEWYAQHRHLLRWDPARKVFVREGNEPGQTESRSATSE